MSDRKRHRFSLLGIEVSFERQTTPDERWHFMVQTAGSRGGERYGWELKKGWCWMGNERKRYCFLAHLQGHVSVSVRPSYRLVYAGSFIHDLAHLTGEHPIKVAQDFIATGRKIVSAVAEGASDA